MRIRLKQVTSDYKLFRKLGGSCFLRITRGYVQYEIKMLVHNNYKLNDIRSYFLLSNYTIDLKFRLHYIYLNVNFIKYIIYIC